MIVLEQRSWLGLLFVWRGSVLARIWRRLAFVTAVSGAVTWAEVEDAWHATLTPLPFTLVGLALSIFLGFRNNTSYDRFWEGRKLWGRLVNTSRSFARQVLTLVEAGGAPTPTPLQRALVRRQMAYVHALRLHLRGSRAHEELQAFLPHDEVAALARESNPPIALLQTQGELLAAAWRAGQVHPLHVPVLEGTLTDLSDIQGGCERIRSTPIPFGYTLLMHRIVGFYCLALPFGIGTQIGALTPLVVFFIAYAFLGLDALGDELEDPFGTDANDLPLSQLSRMIEINLRERLGETELPEPLRPVGGRLT
jgi:putative membrane protein